MISFVLSAIVMIASIQELFNFVPKP